MRQLHRGCKKAKLESNSEPESCRESQRVVYPTRIPSEVYLVSSKLWLNLELWLRVEGGESLGDCL